jgi:N-acetylglutamate synthase-like GNAT family acetyltransferase
MSENRFRFATVDDVAAIHELIERAYRGPEALSSWTSEAGLLSTPRTSAEEIAKHVGRDECRFVVAERDGRVVGCALIEKHGVEGYFGMLAIHPGLQGTGLGKALLARVESSVRELWHCNAMTLKVINLRHEIIGWYERRGYALTGRRDPFPFELHPASGRDDFDFVEMKKIF